MPRRALGLAKKSEVVSVRLTPREVADLTAKYGSAATGLRALYTASKKEQGK
jgi:hypothetical protein